MIIYSGFPNGLNTILGVATEVIEERKNKNSLTKVGE
jgi:4-carboxymuconolactone decarboxylase